MCLNVFLQGMIIEMVFHNEIQIFFLSNQFIFLKGKKNTCVHY